MFTLIVGIVCFIAGAMLGHVFRPLILKVWARIQAWWDRQPKEPLE